VNRTGEPVKVISERLGQANATITLTVDQHVPWHGRRRPTASPLGSGLIDNARYHDCHEPCFCLT